MTILTQNLLSIRQFALKHPSITEQTLRNLIRFRQIEGCIVHVSNKIFLDEDKFFKLLANRARLI